MLLVLRFFYPTEDMDDNNVQHGQVGELCCAYFYWNALHIGRKFDHRLAKMNL